MTTFLIKTIFNIPNYVRVRNLFDKPDTATQPLNPNNNFVLPELLPEPKDINYSYLGTPVFSPLQIKGGSYVSKGKRINYEGMDLRIVLMDITIGKNIVETPIVGGQGTVKELIGLTDIMVNIKGVLVGQNGESPDEEKQKLVNICNLPVDVEVISPMLRIFKVYNLVIKTATFTQREGFKNIQAFELSCSSNQPIEAQISDV